MKKNSMCAGRAYRKEKLAVQQEKQLNVVSLRTQRTFQTEQPKPANTGPIQPFLSVNTYLSPIEQQKIISEYMSGKSIRAISRELDRDRETVARIVKAPEVQEAIENGRAMLFGAIPDIIESILYAVRNELDGRMGLTLAERLDILPTARSKDLQAQQCTNVPIIDEEAIFRDMKPRGPIFFTAC